MRLHPLLSVALLVLPATAAASSRASRTVTAPDLTPGEKAVIDDAKDDKLDHFDTVTAAIAVSAAPSDVRERATTRWQDFQKTIATEAMARPPRDRAEWLLSMMHSELLGGGYAFFQNDIALAIDEGSYNCVSSAIIYQALATRFGLEVSGILVPSHVYVRVRIAGTDYDIETTSSTGFLLDQDDAKYARFLADMQLDMARKYGRKTDGEKFYRREIDAIDLIAMLYCNLGAKAVEDGKQSLAVSQFARAVLLAKDDKYARDSRDLLLGQMAEEHILKNELEDARKLFLFAIKDPGANPEIAGRFKENVGYCYALEAKHKVDKKDYEGALAAYHAGSKYDADPALPHDEAATYNRWGIEELEAKQYARAVSVFLRARNTFPNDKLFLQNLKATYAAWIEADLAAKQLDDAATVWRESHKSLPNDEEMTRVLASSGVRIAETWADDGKWQQATIFIEEALAAAPKVPGMRQSASALWTNAGVAATRAGDNPRAATCWKRAIAIDPDGSSAARKNLESMR